MKGIIGIGFMIVGLVALLAWVVAEDADANVGNHLHHRAHTFEWDYNAQFNVYCAWRHGFEGISCVNIHE